MDSIYISSGMALAFGALHVLEPGHGKTALLSYFASKKRNYKESIIVSLSSAITHSLTVFLIAFATHYFYHHTSLEWQISRIHNFLSMGSGFLILSIGMWFILSGLSKKEHKSHCSCAAHRKSESNVPILKKGIFTSSLLGIATGIIPCPSIVVAFVAGISSGNFALGIENVLLFSLGMFLSLFLLLTFCGVGSERLLSKLNVNKLHLNWSLIQGVIFILLGLFIAFYH